MKKLLFYLMLLPFLGLAQSVGDFTEGGIVFYIDEANNYGLVADIEDLPNAPWGCNGTEIPNANGAAVGAGLQNSLDIVAGCTEIPTAASQALNSTNQGYSDWYLPSANELMEMYNSIGNGSVLGNIGGFKTNGAPGYNFYTSSTQTSSIHATFVNFLIGATGAADKYKSGFVRAIRSFSLCEIDTDADGICDEFEIVGCQDTTACNYDVLATDAGNCTYAELNYDCTGTCINDADVDGICDESEIVGCQDATACNYDALATDAGDCSFAEENYDCDGNALVTLDGIVYTTVTIGNQTWLSENYRGTKYRDGSDIPLHQSNSDWSGSTGGAYCTYDGASSGNLYNAYAVLDSRNMAPEGWKVASDHDWNVLKEYLIANGYGYEGSGNDIGKALAITSGWAEHSQAGFVGNDQSTNNSSGLSLGFNAQRWHNADFYGGNTAGSFWSIPEEANNLYIRDVWYAKGDMGRYTVMNNDPHFGIAVRLVKDNIGCTDALACNYNPYAEIDAGNCTYAELNYDCSGACVNDVDADGVCDELEVLGCTDEVFSNYDSSATEDDGTCVSWQEAYQGMSTQIAILQAELDVALANQEQHSLVDRHIDIPEGWSIFGYTCVNGVDVVEALGAYESQIEIVKDEMGLAWIIEYGYNALGSLEYGQGYQIKTYQSIENFQFCPNVE